MDAETRRGPGGIIKAAAAGLVVLFVLIGGCSSIQMVDTGHVGIKLRFREVVDKPMPAGLYFVNPITTDVVEMDTRVLKWDGKTGAYTKDVQQASVQFTLNYRLDPSAAGEVYATVGTEWVQRLVGQVIHEAIKREFGQHNAVDIVAQRDSVANTIEEIVRAELLSRHVLVPNFQLTNLDFTEAFEHAVEAKVIAEQDAIREKNKTVQIEELAKQAIATAKGDADATLLRAKAEAESIRIRAQALEANPRLVEFEAVKRWNGELPVNMYGSAPVPFINIPNKKE